MTAVEAQVEKRAERTLCAEAVDFAYDEGKPVFREVSATVAGGVLTGIVGPNGSGKSTLLRVLSGLRQPTRGRVLLDSRPLSRFTRRERARSIGFLPQSVNPAFSLSVLEVVYLGRFPHLNALGAPTRHDKDVAMRCLHDTGSEQFAERGFDTLSGGERQRVLLASILAQEPDLLLLDEPTSALDIHHQVEIFTLLKRLAGEGYGVAVVTHDLNLAAQFCDRLLLLSTETGGLLADGSPDAVLTESLLSRAYAARIRVGVHPLTGSILVAAEHEERNP